MYPPKCVIYLQFLQRLKLRQESPGCMEVCFSFLVLIMPLLLSNFGADLCSSIASQEGCKTEEILELVSWMGGPHCSYSSGSQHFCWYAYCHSQTFTESWLPCDPYDGASCYCSIRVHTLAPMEETSNMEFFCCGSQT